MVMRTLRTHRSACNGNLFAARNLAHPVILTVGDPQVSLGIDGAAVRPIEAGLRRGTAVAARSLAPAGHGGDAAGFGRNLADRVVLGIDDVKIAIGVRADTLGALELSLQRGAPVAGRAPGPGAGDGRDDALPIHLANGASLALADIDIA